MKTLITLIFLVYAAAYTLRMIVRPNRALKAADEVSNGETSGPYIRHGLVYRDGRYYGSERLNVQGIVRKTR